MYFVPSKFYDIKSPGAVLLGGVSCYWQQESKVHTLWYKEDAFGVNSKDKIYELFVLRTQSQALSMKTLYFKKVTWQIHLER